MLVAKWWIYLFTDTTSKVTRLYTQSRTKTTTRAIGIQSSKQTAPTESTSTKPTNHEQTAVHTSVSSSIEGTRAAENNLQSSSNTLTKESPKTTSAIPHVATLDITKGQSVTTSNPAKHPAILEPKLPPTSIQTTTFPLTATTYESSKATIHASSKPQTSNTTISTFSEQKSFHTTANSETTVLSRAETSTHILPLPNTHIHVFISTRTPATTRQTVRTPTLMSLFLVTRQQSTFQAEIFTSVITTNSPLQQTSSNNSVTKFTTDTNDSSPENRSNHESLFTYTYKYHQLISFIGINIHFIT